MLKNKKEKKKLGDDEQGKIRRRKTCVNNIQDVILFQLQIRVHLSLQKNRKCLLGIILLTAARRIRQKKKKRRKRKKEKKVDEQMIVCRGFKCTVGFKTKEGFFVFFCSNKEIRKKDYLLFIEENSSSSFSNIYIQLLLLLTCIFNNKFIKKNSFVFVLAVNKIKNLMQSVSVLSSFRN